MKNYCFRDDWQQEGVPEAESSWIVNGIINLQQRLHLSELKLSERCGVVGVSLRTTVCFLHSDLAAVMAHLCPRV